MTVSEFLWFFIGIAAGLMAALLVMAMLIETKAKRPRLQQPRVHYVLGFDKHPSINWRNDRNAI